MDVQQRQWSFFFFFFPVRHPDDFPLSGSVSHQFLFSAIFFGYECKASLLALCSHSQHGLVETADIFCSFIFLAHVFFFFIPNSLHDD